VNQKIASTEQVEPSEKYNIKEFPALGG